MSSCAAPGQKRRLFKDAGRACPVDYRIPEDAFSGNPEFECDVLYVVGGLYGNPFALERIDEMVSSEEGDVLVVFNGDMHWFDKTAENFGKIEDHVANPPVPSNVRYFPMVGNVEAELRRQVDVGVGCGCAYPECTSDESVSRSNRIHRMLSVAIDRDPGLKERLEGRPATTTVKAAGKKVAITHGDEKLIGGWDCSRETLQDVMRQDELDSFMLANDIDIMATTHTCAPAAITLARGTMVNNGAAGLPNFAGQHYGLLIRIAADRHPDALFGCTFEGVEVEAVPVRYDHDAYLTWFDYLWDEFSPAAISYRDRVVNGPDDRLADSLLGGYEFRATAIAEAGPDVAGEDGKAHAGKRDVKLALAKLLYFEDMVDDRDCLSTVEKPETLQLNITARCNLACAHCHVESSPARTESASREVLEAVLSVVRERGLKTLDITGGAPEMHPDIEWFLCEAVDAAEKVMVRTNLTILQNPGYAYLLDLYAQLGIEVVASLPNVFAAQADAQRGKNVHDRSLEVLRKLNERGYGMDGVHVLDLVFNPQEPVLPPLQEDLELVYKRRLGDVGIAFDNLFAVANMPIGRYGASLLDSGAFDNYVETLIDSFNQDACPAMMCRHQISVGWDGKVYDCDFNQALGLAQKRPDGMALDIRDYAADSTLELSREIIFGNHCYACTAGFGSSCGGTLVQG